MCVKETKAVRIHRRLRRRIAVLVLAAAGVGGMTSPMVLGADASWVNGSGSWSDASHWNPALVPNNGIPTPGAAYDAFIVTVPPPGPETPFNVTIDQSVTLNNLTLTSAAATVIQKGTLTLAPGGYLNVNAGAYNVSFGTISIGTINVGSGATFHAGGLTLVDANVIGRITVDPDTGMELRGTTTFHGAEIHLNAASKSAQLWVNGFPGTDMLSGSVSVFFDGTTNGTVHGASALVIGPQVTVRTGTSTGFIRTNVSQSTITNNGTIAARTAGKSITVGDTNTATFSSNGTLEASGGGMLDVRHISGNAGTLLISGTSQLRLSSSFLGSFTINRSLTLNAGNALSLSGNFEIAQPLTVNSGASLLLAGAWTNSAAVTVNGATITLASANGGDYSHPPGASFSVTDSSVGLANGLFNTAFIQSYMTNGNRVTVNNGGWIDNRNATLNITNAIGSFAINSATIQGGTIITGGAAAIDVPANTSAAQFFDVDLLGRIQLGNLSTALFGDGTYAIGKSINHGTISGSNATLRLVGQWENSGVIALAGGVLQLDGPAISMGTINLTDSLLVLRSDITLAQLNEIQGTIWRMNINLGGKLDLCGGTLAPSSSTGTIGISGMVSNGTLAAPGGFKFDMGAGTLRNITLATNVTLPARTTVAIQEGLSLAGATVSIENNISTYSQRSGMRFAGGTQSFSGSGQVVFNGSGTANMVGTSSATVTIGAGILVRTGLNSGMLAGELGSSSGYGRFINQGTIRASGAGRDVTFIQLDAFTNGTTGRLEALNEGKLFFSGTQTLLKDVVNDGTIHLENGTVTATGVTFTNSTTGTIEGTGTLDMTGTNLINHGTISPGLSPGKLTINGNVTSSPNSSIKLQLGGSSDDLIDQLLVNGSLTLDGTLVIELLNGYEPAATDLFSLVQATSLTGSFGQVSSPSGEFQVSMEDGQLTLTGFDPVPEPTTGLVSAVATALLIARRRRGGRVYRSSPTR